MPSLTALRAEAKKARAAADKSVKEREPKEAQRKLAAVACDLEEQVRFAEAVKFSEEQGYEVTGDNFGNAQVLPLTEGPTYNDKPGA